MERTVLGAATIVLAITAQAQLSPTTEAPLYRHLLEVNKEWRVMDPMPAGGDRMVHFTNEAERIATHLHLVAAYERSHVPEGLSAEATAQRTTLLDKLDAYADRGVFPQNDVLPVRNPVFIDPHGTACAVGQLMIESGNDGLAKRIQEEMNLAYVHDMRRPDVQAWAGDHGFTEDELAWIQPGYPPSIPWYALGSGTDGAVTELLRMSDGDLLLAGDFQMAGGLYATHVARWNGTAYEGMGSVDGEVTSAIEFDGSYYMGGTFLGGSYDLVRWTGSMWEMSMVFSGKYAHISDLHIHDGVLHAAGSTMGFAGTSYEVKKLVNGNWENIGQQLNGEIKALETFDGTLVCGGAFTGDFFESDTSLLHVARLNTGIWEQLGDGLNGRVRDLLPHQGQLVAAGDCVGEVATYFGLARIAIEALTWEQLMPNVSNYMYSPLDGIVGINAMSPDPDGVRIHLGGDFYAAEMLTNGMGLATFHGEADAVTVLGEFFGPVHDLERFGTSELIAGGASETLLNIASTDLTLSLPSHSDVTSVSVWPNPTTDHLRIGGLENGADARIEVLDATGRFVKRITGLPVRNTIDVRDLPIGSYTVRIITDNKTLSSSFIKR